MPRIDQQLHNRIYDRVQMLIEGKVEDPDSETPLSKEALTAKLTDLLYKANELRFTTEMALGDMGIARDNYPDITIDLENAFDDLDIPLI